MGCVAAIVVLLLLLWEPAAVLAAMERSLQLCARTIIPALFPYLVASELLVSSGAGERLARLFYRPLHAIFGVSHCGAVVYVMGLLCGFPIAARSAATYAACGKITREEETHLLTFCNVPSAAFVINAVGVSLYKSAAFGRLLWGLSVLAAAAVGVMLRPYGKKREAEQQAVVSPVTSDATIRSTLSSATIRAAGALIAVVATVLFFGALLGAAQSLLARLAGSGRLAERTGLLPLWSSLLSALLELTSGAAAAAALQKSALPALRALSPLLCAAAVGWGGLSVHAQLLSCCEATAGKGRYIRFYLARLLQALLCMGGMMLLWRGGGACVLRM